MCRVSTTTTVLLWKPTIYSKYCVQYTCAAPAGRVVEIFQKYLDISLGKFPWSFCRLCTRLKIALALHKKVEERIIFKGVSSKTYCACPVVYI
jgi:hypothetical protein